MATRMREVFKFKGKDSLSHNARDDQENVGLLEDHFEQESGSDEGHEEEVEESDQTEGATFTVEEAVEKIGFGWFQIKLFLVCGLFSATDALEMMLLAVLSPVLRCEWQLEEWEVALITTVVFIGMFSMSHFWGAMADKYGRKPILLMAALWILYFGILTSFSPNYVWVLILRGLVGAGFGGAVQNFTLFCEYLPHKWRAKTLVMSSMTWAAGSTFEIMLAYLVIPTLGWRWLVAFSALPTIISILFLWQLPESARYLVAAGKKEKALETLEKIAKINKSSLPPGELIETQTVERGNFYDLFRPKKFAYTSIVLWLLWFTTAFSYYGVILASSEILEFHKACGAGASEQDMAVDTQCKCHLLSPSDYGVMIVSTFGEFVSIPFNLITIDALGRKKTLSINFALTGIFYLLINICTTKVIMTGFIFGIRGFANGIFNTIYIYTGEVYPTSIRSLALGSSSAMARVGCMITPFVAQVLLEHSLSAALGVYGGLCLLAACLAFFLPIETKGREMATHTTG